MFNIQAFGSNDTLTASDILTIGIERADGTYQNYNIPHPAESAMNETSIKNVVNLILNQSATSDVVFIDSKTGELLNVANGAKVGTAYRTEKTIRTLDLS